MFRFVGLVLGDVDALLVEALLELNVAHVLTWIAAKVAQLLIVAALLHSLRWQIFVFYLQIWIDCLNDRAQ